MRHSVLIVCALATACARDSSGVLASGAGVTVTAAEFLLSINDASAAERATYADDEKKRQALEALIDFEVLVAQARSLGLDRDPKIVRATKEMMVQRLLHDRQSQNPTGKIQSEDEQRAQFEADSSRHALPETVRLAHVFFKAAAAGDRALRLSEATAVRSTALAFPSGADGNPAFGELARQHSDEAATALNAGDLTSQTHEQLQAYYSKAVADGAFALTELGQISPVLESAHGLHLFRLLARSAARVPTFEEYRAAQSAPKSRAQREEEQRLYVKQLRGKSGVVIREAELKRLNPLAVPVAP